MSAKMHMLKVVVSERLTQVAEEICSLVEKILLEYEQDLYRSIAPQMDLHLHTTTDVSLQRFTGLVVVESCDDSPKENHNISDPEEALPRPEPSIKEEQEDEWSAGFEDPEPQAPPQRHEMDSKVIKFIYSPVCKSEQLNTEPSPTLSNTEAQHTTPPPEDAVPCTSTEPCAAVTAVLCLPADFQTVTEPYVDPEAKLAADGGVTARRRRLWLCKVCKVSFSDRGSMMNHAKVHADDCVRKCGICGKLLPTREGLLEHLQTHVHVCECCGETFIRLVDLSVHMRCHTGKKLYTCKGTDLPVPRTPRRQTRPALQPTTPQPTTPRAAKKARTPGTRQTPDTDTPTKKRRQCQLDRCGGNKTTEACQKCHKRACGKCAGAFFMTCYKCL